jgi:RNA polymerase sigma factor (sigma-70 family)
LIHLKSAVEKTFVDLLQKHQNIVHKICRLYTNDVDAHNDLFQEISIQLWKAYPKFRGESKFSTWMYRVGLNTSITLYRKSLRRVESQSIESVAYKISQEEYDDLEDEQLKLIYAAIHRLNDIEKGIIFLYLENKNYREISETLGISEVNARVRMNRIKTKLKTQLTS